MSDFLSAMAAASHSRAERANASAAVFRLRSRAEGAPPPITLELSDDGFDVIAEAKLKSPSEGPLVGAVESGSAAKNLASEFERGGAVAISVLTEPTAFAGSLSHLHTVSRSSSIPVMRKDFLVDPIQVMEARAAGASGVLLIARMLEGPPLEEMTDLALELGMFVLVELFDPSDLEAAQRVFDRPVLVGVNSRDLGTLQIDSQRFADMAALLPKGLPWVAESGVHNDSDATTVARLGYQVALVGSSLVKSSDPAQKVGSLLAAGRAARAHARVS